MEKHIYITEQDFYLAIPIKAKQEKEKIFLLVDEFHQSEFHIPINKESEEVYDYDFLAYIPLWQFCGKEIVLKGNFTQGFMEYVHTTKHVVQDTRNRPLLHFTPEYGWINDPNGLVYQGGLYHLYFQYNPFDTEWDNMSWGHAISSDLLHWEQKDTVLFPDEDGTIFSGCGIVNEFGLLGLPKDALLFFYSAAGGANELSKGKDFVQKLAYSLDSGITLVKKQTVLPAICKENRDPKVFWHALSKSYIMCLWLKKNEFAIFRSSNLEHFEISQRFHLNEGFECPDLFELKVEEMTGKGSKESSWVFWCADGYYYLGTFDGYEFLTDGVRKEAYTTKLPYAAQTISNMKNRVLSIPWLRTKTVDKLYTGCMGLPRELSLCRLGNDVRLKQSLPKEIRDNQNLILSKYEKEMEDIKLEWASKGALCIELKMEDPKSTVSNGINGSILGSKIEYDVTNGLLKVEDNQIQIGGHITDFSMIFDQGIIEITANDDIIYAVFEVDKSILNKEIYISSKDILELAIYEVI